MEPNPIDVGILEARKALLLCLARYGAVLPPHNSPQRYINKLNWFEKRSPIISTHS